MWRASLTIGVALAYGCSDIVATSRDGNLPLDVSVVSVTPAGNNTVSFTARLISRTNDPVVLSVHCTPLQTDQNVDGSWKRIDDLRLCAPPNQMVVPGKVTLELTDVRALGPGQFRAVVESPDGRLAFSAPFAIAAR